MYSSSGTIIIDTASGRVPLSNGWGAGHGFVKSEIISDIGDDIEADAFEHPEQISYIGWRTTQGLMYGPRRIDHLIMTVVARD